MENLTFTFYDVVQIVLLLAACWACKASGYQKGIADTIGFFEDKGIYCRNCLTPKPKGVIIRKMEKQL